MNGNLNSTLGLVVTVLVIVVLVLLVIRLA